MKRVVYAVVSLILLFIMGCSLPPERPVKKDELYRTGIYNYYKIQESPERVLAALNKDGEVVLEVEYKKQPLYLKILATSKGLVLSVSER
ncbi:hypothetical protein [Geotalea sp. SG265]|uniref:hypothetical protein n=1 Tax=Geotalea sp. SG265 TaxID=2922867 RepID=UPI001FAE9879|nr:hypothetical protein [Geotalea sp. SG265]